MVITCYSGFSKKPNSTKQPTGGSDKTVTLKEPTSVMRPVFILQGYDLSYNYIKWGSRYYFVDDIVVVHNNVAEYHCSTDVLATFKSDIGSSSQYVTRAASTYDGDIIDMLYPTVSEITQTAQAATQDPGWTHTINSGCFVIGVQGKSAGQNGGAVTYYAVKPAAVQAITTYLLDPQNLGVTDISDELLECIFNPMQFIVSCQWFPFLPQTLGADTIHVGWWDISTPSGSCSVLTSPVYTRNMSFTIPKHPQAASRGNYLNMAPFSRYLLNAGPWGIMPLDNAILLDDSSLDCFMNVDLYTGSARLSIVGSQALTYVQEFVCQVGVPVQLGQNMLNQGAISGITQGIGGVIGGLMGDPASMLGGGLSAIKSAAELSQAMPTSIGSNGSINFNTQFNLIGMFYKVANDDNTSHGRPLCQAKTISSLSGYILTENADLDTSASPAEKDTMLQMMNTGFYYE